MGATLHCRHHNTKHTGTHTLHQTVTSLVVTLLHARLGGMDAVSELMEQGEHGLAVNRRRWRRDQGALEAHLCIGYTHCFSESCIIVTREILTGM